MYLKYMGEFLSRAGVVWRVEIFQEAEQAWPAVGSLTFEADEALVIEWEQAAKDDVVCGSTATLRIESPGDRTYQDLYTVAPGTIRMDVYREGALYWSGMLDPEFYEEPYERAARYPVSLTFSDFGILDRLKYDLMGMTTLRSIVNECLRRAGLNTVRDESLISTSLSPAGAPMELDALRVRSDNFYDEDGEPMTLRKVLEGVLQPLGLRIIQRAGKVWIHDLNALYSMAPQLEAKWDGDRQTMGTDRVYNNARITWSPYAQSGNLAPTDCWTEDTDPTRTALDVDGGEVVGDCRIYSYHTTDDVQHRLDPSDCGFTLWTSTKGEHVEIPDPEARFFKIVPQNDGQESEGVALVWPSRHLIFYRREGISMDVMKGTIARTGGVVFRTEKVQLPPVVKDGGRLAVRVALNLMLDPRINPFEAAWDDVNDFCKDWEKKWNLRGNFVYVPVSIHFRPAGTLDSYTWDNRDVLRKDVKNDRVATAEKTMGRWVKDTGAVSTAWGYLAYYNSDDRQEKSGVMGWKKNRPAINPHRGYLLSSLANSEDGQLLPYPAFGTAGGELWIDVHTGWVLSDGNENIPADRIIDSYGLWSKYSWALCQLPEIEVVNNNLYDTKISDEDVEYSAEINPDAKEDIEIDTVCGTAAEGVPMARGAYFNATTGSQITELSRAGRTTQAEELLIGTLFSQYAERRTRLSGDMTIADGPLAVYTEANQGDRIFMLTADTQDVIADVSTATITELRPDEYDKE
ncbi:MAG: hypothetical protein K2L21_05520 [Muribaculaceae bacterium]|nr:hypothetical protein [Muribaculaceae bacterium]